MNVTKTQTNATNHIDAFSTAGPVSRQIYNELLTALRPNGPFEQEVKKTSIHFVRRSAFADVSFRKQHLILTIKAVNAIGSPRILKAEQASKNRWHLEVKLTAAENIDAELLSWLRDAYEL
jgi:hypothetical protein